MKSEPVNTALTGGLYADIFMSSPLPVFIFSQLHFQVVAANDAACRLYGFPDPAQNAIPVSSFWQIDKKNHHWPAYDGSSTDFHLDANGHKVWVEYIAYKVQPETDPFIVVNILRVSDKLSILGDPVNLLEKLESIADVQKDVIFRFYPDTTLTYVNQAYLNTFSLTKENALGHKFLEFVQPAEVPRILNHLEKIKNTLSEYSYEYLEVFPDGNEVWWEWTDIPILNAKGNLLEIQTIGRNITSRKLAQEALMKTERENSIILDSVPDLMFRINRKGVYMSAHINQGWLLYMPAEAFLGQSVSEVLPPEYAQEAMRAIDLAFSSNEMVSYEYRMPLESGMAYFENRIVKSSDNMVLSIIRDITARKVAEEHLQWNVSFLKTMSASSPFAYFVVDNLTDNILYFNRQFCEIWGLVEFEKKMQNGEMLNNDIIPYCLPLIADVDAFIESCTPLQDIENITSLEDHIRFTDGRTIRRYTTQVRGEQNEYFGRLYIFEDITERIKAEEALKSSEDRFHSMFYAHENVMLLSDPATGEIIEANKAATKYYGRDFYAENKVHLNEIFTNPLRCKSRVSKKQMPALGKYFKNIVSGGHERKVEIYSSDVEISGKQMQFDIVHDITERNKMQEALLDSEMRWKFALEGNGDGLWDWDISTGEVYFSNQWKAMLGFAPEEIDNNLSEWEKRVHPDDLESTYALINKHLQGETDSYESEHRVLCKNGTYKWILDRGKIILSGKDGVAQRMIGTHHDISERKRSEDKIRDKSLELDSQNRFLNDLLELLPFRLYWKDKDLRFAGANRLFLQDKKLESVGDILGKRNAETNWKEYAKADERDDYEIIQSGIPRMGREIEYLVGSGKKIWIRIYKMPIRDASNKINGIFVAYEDITHRKIAEEKIARNEYFLNELVNLIGHLLKFDSTEKLFGELSRRLPRLFSADSCYMVQKISGEPADDIQYFATHTLSASVKTEVDAILLSLSDNLSVSADPLIYNFYDQDGKHPYKGPTHPIGDIVLAMPVIYNRTTVGAAILGFRNLHKFSSDQIEEARLASNMLSLIVARNNVMADLNQSERMMRSFIENAPVGIMAANRKGEYKLVNEAAAELTGYTVEQLLSMNVSDLVHPETADTGILHFNRIIESGVAVDDSLIRRSDGSGIWCTIQGVKLSDDLYLAFHININERILTRKALIAEKSLLTALFNSIPEVVFYKSPDGRYQGGNIEFEKTLGCQLADIKGKTDAELFDVKTAKLLNRNDKQVIESGAPMLYEELIPVEKNNKSYFETLKAPFYDQNGNLLGVLGVSRNITERKKFDALLREKESWMRALLNSMKDLVLVIDHKGRFTESYNLSDNQSLFASESSIINVHYSKILPADVTEKLENALSQIRQGRDKQAFSYTLNVKGVETWWQAVVSPIIFAAGGKESYIAVVRDISHEVKITSHLMAERQLFIEGPTVIFRWEISPGWPLQYVSPNVLGMLGYSADVLESGVIQFEELIHPDDRERINTQAEQCVNSNIIHFHQEYRLKRADSKYIVVSDYSTIFINNHGKPQSILGYLQDISKYREMEDSLVYRSALQQILMAVAGNFINIPIDKVNEAVDEALGHVGRFVEVDRAYIFDYDFKAGVTNNTFEWCARGVTAEIENLKNVPIEGIEEWVKIHRQGRSMIVEDVDKLKNKQLKEILQAQSIKSLIAVPMVNAGELLGFIGFDSVREVKIWTETERELLHFMAQLFTNARMRIHFENELRQSRERFQTIYENTTIGLYRTTLDGRILMVNPAIVQMLGYTHESELTSIDLNKMDSVINIDRAKFISTILRDGYVRDFETQWLKKDGTPIYIRESARVFYLPDGQISHFDGSVEDISLRRQAEKALAESEEKFRQLAENVESLFWIANTGNHKLVYLNSEFTRCFGAKAVSEATHLFDLGAWMHPNDLELVKEAYRNYLAGHELDIECRFYILDNQERWFKVRSFRIMNEDGILIRHAGIASDITAQKQAEASLIESLNAERQLNELKSRFISMTSHEFRTPLATIMASAETIQAYRNRMTDEQIDNRLSKIFDQVEHMKILMNDVLDLAKVEARTSSFNPVLGNLAELIADIVEEFNAYSPGHQRVKFLSSQNEIFFGFDAVIMRQVITNLVSNAIKYSPDGSEVVVELSDSDECINMIVADHGIGIPEEDIRHLFEPFFRSTNVGKIAGTGLGMPIVKQGIEMHNGIVNVESVVDRGTTIFCKLNR